MSGLIIVFRQMNYQPYMLNTVTDKKVAAKGSLFGTSEEGIARCQERQPRRGRQGLGGMEFLWVWNVKSDYCNE